MIVRDSHVQDRAMSKHNYWYMIFVWGVGYEKGFQLYSATENIKNDEPILMTFTHIDMSYKDFTHWKS